MTSPNDPTSPTYKPQYGAKGEVIAWVPHGGLTKREEFAKAAMQGLLSNSSVDLYSPDLAPVAAKFAHDMLAELAKGET